MVQIYVSVMLEEAFYALNKSKPVKYLFKVDLTKDYFFLKIRAQNPRLPGYLLTYMYS